MMNKQKKQKLKTVMRQFEIAFFVLVLTFGIWQNIQAALPNEDFESYSDGASLENLDGGTNWDGPYGHDTNAVNNCAANFTAAASPVVDGSRAGGGVAGLYCSRGFDHSADFIFTIKMRPAQTNVTYRLILHDSFVHEVSIDEIVVLLLFDTDANIKVYNNLTLTTLQAYTANTVYEFDIEFNFATEEFRIAVNNGSWSSWYFTYGYTTQTNDKLQGYQILLDAAASRNIWDTISSVAESPVEEVVNFPVGTSTAQMVWNIWFNFYFASIIFWFLAMAFISFKFITRYI